MSDGESLDCVMLRWLEANSQADPSLYGMRDSYSISRERSDMRVSEIFTKGGGDRGWNYENCYGNVCKPGGYYPDNGRWTYVYENDYNWAGGGYGYGYTRSHGLDGLVG